MAYRGQKVNEEIKRALAEILRDVKDPRLGELISVTGVEATSDLKQAKVFVSVFGDTYAKKEAMKGLEAADGFIRYELGERIDLHTLPDLIFELDNSIDNGARIDKILKEIKDNS